MAAAKKTATLTVAGLAAWSGAGRTFEAGVPHEVNGHDKKLLAAVEAAQGAGTRIELDGDVGKFPGQVEEDHVSLGKLEEAQASGAHAAALEGAAGTMAEGEE